MFKIIASLAVVGLAALIVVENNQNSLAYQFSNCTEVSNNSGYIGFNCPARNPNYPGTQYFVPESERSQVVSDMNPLYLQNNSL